MKRLRGWAASLVVFAAGFWATAPLYAWQATPGQGGFVPAESVPGAEQVPAAPLLIAAYAFAWIIVFFYVWTVWRRLGKVEREMHSLERRQAERGGAR